MVRYLKVIPKKNILNLIGLKTAIFILEKEYTLIPDELKKFNPILESKKLFINYDKSTTKLKEIIKLLNENNILFNELNTRESDLEDVFLDLIKK